MTHAQLEDAAAEPHTGTTQIDSMTPWIERAIADSPNHERLRLRLESIRDEEALVRFVHRFVLFNDALAARVPFLAGVIHLTPGLFLDPEAQEEFCRQANGRIAAFVAKAANDEYLFSETQSLVHQYLSQQFFRGVLAHYGVSEQTFDNEHPLPLGLDALLKEARGKFFGRRSPEEIFAALGFHVGLEFFADQEFTLVDGWLRERYPELVRSLEAGGKSRCAYRWLAIHTVVEITHYRAGLEALETALAYFRDPKQTPRMLECIKHGFSQFADLQGRYYEAILSDAA
jgi:hypothetical protein